MNRRNGLGACALTPTLCTIFTIFSSCQGPGAQGTTGTAPDVPFGFLKQALGKAGAATLSTDLETALKAYIAASQDADRPAAHRIQPKQPPGRISTMRY